MDQRTKKKFQVIGACARTQTLSLDEEIRLIEAVPYNLDIFQDFSVRQLSGSVILDISTLDLCKMIDKTENVVSTNYIVSHSSVEVDYQQRKLICEAYEEQIEELRWEEKKNKISGKKAVKNLESVLRNLGVD